MSLVHIHWLSGSLAPCGGVITINIQYIIDFAADVSRLQTIRILQNPVRSWLLVPMEWVLMQAPIFLALTDKAQSAPAMCWCVGHSHQYQYWTQVIQQHSTVLMSRSIPMSTVNINGKVYHLYAVSTNIYWGIETAYIQSRMKLIYTITNQNQTQIFLLSHFLIYKSYLSVFIINFKASD